MSQPKLWKQLLAEFIGTFLLVLIGAGAVAYFASKETEYSLITALAFGTVMAVIIYLFGSISGAHVNPAVSLGFALTRRMQWGYMFLYWIAQFLGGILAAITIYWIFDKETGSSVGTLTFTDHWKAVFVEALITTILVFSMLYMTKNWKVSIMGGIVIGCVLVFNYIFAGNLTGASANPARSLGPAIMGAGQWSTLWIYFVGPLIGAIIASILYSIMNMSGYSVVKDCDGNPIKNGCCDNILGKECQMKDNCGNPMVDDCCNPITFTKYKIDIKKKDQYRFFKCDDHAAVHGGHTKNAHQALCHEDGKEVLAGLVKVGPDHDRYGTIGIKDAALERIGKSQQQELTDFVNSKSGKPTMKTVAMATTSMDSMGDTVRTLEVNSTNGSLSAVSVQKPYMSSNLSQKSFETSTMSLPRSSIQQSMPRISTGNVKLPSLNQLTDSMVSSRPFAVTTSLNKAFTGAGTV